ncbi:hypothetical protein AB0F17_18165 [Nonomuraea sp. NPDC026600]|uniref:hypothetical protein n=1 Tax=Nonomuraea sp. NPDC026600 TaxID=3155363 RepID=UPI0033D98571
MTNHEWTPYIPSGNRTRVVEASCCNQYQLLQEGGAYVVTLLLDATPIVETARGSTGRARQVFDDLVALHLIATQEHRP